MARMNFYPLFPFLADFTGGREQNFVYFLRFSCDFRKKNRYKRSAHNATENLSVPCKQAPGCSDFYHGRAVKPSDSWSVEHLPKDPCRRTPYFKVQPDEPQKSINVKAIYCQLS